MFYRLELAQKQNVSLQRVMVNNDEMRDTKKPHTQKLCPRMGVGDGR
jgi:hypothetical protein